MRYVPAAILPTLLFAFSQHAYAGPGVTVLVVPRYYSPNPYSPYYYRPIGPQIGDGVPIIPPVPSVFQYGGVPIQAPGTVITGPAIGLPQLAAPGLNAGQGPIPQFGAAPAGGPEIDQALQLLSNPRERDRIEAAITLGRNKVQKAIDPLERVLATDTSPRVREAAARGLGLIGAPSSLKALQNAAQADDDRDVRHSAQFAAETIRATTR